MTTNTDLCTSFIYMLAQGIPLTREQYRILIEQSHTNHRVLAAELAQDVRNKWYGKRIYLRGLIEFTNYCRCNCFYCGIRRSNSHLPRYRLTEDQILNCCVHGYSLGLRTFVLQGGEDVFFTDERLCHIITIIRDTFPDCAVTLSLGERNTDSYRKLKEAGADRYLLRHETADPIHYVKLHPMEQTYAHRMHCLKELKKLGYQTGAGMMIGSPGQTSDSLAQDLEFLGTFKPHMVGIGPFLPHHATPFATEPPGNIEQTLFILSLVRLLLPDSLLPATTAVATASKNGRIRALEAGANVIMPNLTPEIGKNYELYNGKLRTGLENVDSLLQLRTQLAQHGYTTPVSRGDHISMDKTIHQEE